MKILIPTPLYSYTEKKPVVRASGKTLNEVSFDLDRQFPGFRFRIIDEQDHIRPHIKIFVNREQEFDLARSVQESDEIAIVQAFSGG